MSLLYTPSVAGKRAKEDNMPARALSGTRHRTGTGRCTRTPPVAAAAAESCDCSGQGQHVCVSSVEREVRSARCEVQSVQWAQQREVRSARCKVQSVQWAQQCGAL